MIAPAFVVVSGGARSESVGRLLASLPNASVLPHECVVVGRHDDPLPPGVLFVPAADLASRAAVCSMRNRGVDATRGDPVILLDDDIEFTPGWWSAFAPSLEAGQFGVTGCRCETPSGRRWYDWNWASRSDPACPTRLLDYTECSHDAYISGCFMAIRRRVLDRVRFDEGRLNHERDDVDFCHRATDAGFSIGVVPTAVVIHHLEPAGRSPADPASGSEAFSMGVAYWRTDEPARALECFRRAAGHEGSKARYHQGLCLLALERSEEAAHAFLDVLNEVAGTADRRLYFGALFRLAGVREREGRVDEAHDLYARTLAGFPEHAEAANGFLRTAPAEVAP